MNLEISVSFSVQPTHKEAFFPSISSTFLIWALFERLDPLDLNWTETHTVEREVLLRLIGALKAHFFVFLRRSDGHANIFKIDNQLSFEVG